MLIISNFMHHTIRYVVCQVVKQWSNVRKSLFYVFWSCTVQFSPKHRQIGTQNVRIDETNQFIYMKIDLVFIVKSYDFF